MRCFIALPLPEEARDALVRALAPLKGRWPRLRWVQPEGFHLTMAFLGEVEGQALACAVAAVGAAISGRSFAFSFGGMGYLPPRGVPRVLYALLDERPEGSSASLYRIVNEALEAEAKRAGLPPLNREWGPGGRPFRPHVTVARVNPGAPVPERGFLSGIAAPGEWTIGRCALYKSDLRPGGAVYTEVSAVALPYGGREQV